MSKADSRAIFDGGCEWLLLAYVICWIISVSAVQVALKGNVGIGVLVFAMSIALQIVCKTSLIKRIARRAQP